MGTTFYLLCIVCVLLAICAARLFKKDVTAIEKLKDDAADAADALKDQGFVVLPKLLRDVSRVEIRTFIKDASKAVRDLLSPDGAAREAKQLFENMFAKHLQDPTQVPVLLAKAQQAAKNLGVSATAA